MMTHPHDNALIIRTCQWLRQYTNEAKEMGLTDKQNLGLISWLNYCLYGSGHRIECYTKGDHTIIECITRDEDYRALGVTPICKLTNGYDVDFMVRDALKSITQSLTLFYDGESIPSPDSISMINLTLGVLS